MKRLVLPFTAACVALATPALSATIAFDLLGKGGAGLSSTNENSSIVTIPNPVGTGGEIASGISYDDFSNILSINVAWGSLNGFTDLSSGVTGSHIHGPTTSGGAASFLENAGVLFSLARVSSTANGGSIATTVLLTEPQELDLKAGKYYINIHTSQNGGGEIRGNLVPEPSHAVLGLLGLGLLSVRRKRG